MPTQSNTVTLDDFFEGYSSSQPIFDSLLTAVKTLEEVDMRVTRSQVAFRRRKAFAWAWVPDRYLHGRHAPLVLTLAFTHINQSPRWKEIVEPYPGRFSHHLELFSTEDLDTEVRIWLREAWEAAG